VPKSGFPAALWVTMWTHQRRHRGNALTETHRFGRTRLGARLDIRGPGQKAGIAYRLQRAWEDPTRDDRTTKAEYVEGGRPRSMR
jgi:hypothetical protein